jgi:putative serine protease PepD
MSQTPEHDANDPVTPSEAPALDFEPADAAPGVADSEAADSTTVAPEPEPAAPPVSAPEPAAPEFAAPDLTSPEPTAPVSAGPITPGQGPGPQAQYPQNQYPQPQHPQPQNPPGQYQQTPYFGPPPQLPPPTPAQAPAPAPVSATAPAPNWATPTTPGLPPYGESGDTVGFGATPAEPKKPGNGRVVLAAALVAAVVGAAVGAGVAYTLKSNSSSTSLGSANTSSATSSLNSDSANATAVTAVAAKVVPSVVTITVESPDGSGDEGTGIIISSTGQILTNNHVIAADETTGSTLTVTFNSGKITPATILGADPSSDLAVIQATGVSGLTPATLGDSSKVAVGQQVVAIGAPLGLTNTVTSGIVSALNRPVAPESDDPSASTTSTAVLDAIQTDAAINPGNSGGPLVDLSGQVIGIDSAIASDGSDSGDSQAGSIGLGFAIPINQAKPIAEELIKTGKAPYALLGVGVVDPSATATHTGATVNSITASGPAANAGLRTNDVITAVDDQQIGDAESLVAAIRSYQPGTTVTLTYIRGSQTLTARITLGTAPAPAPTASSGSGSNGGSGGN